MEELKTQFETKYPLISELINNTITGLAIGSSHYESDGDFEEMKNLDEEATKLTFELESIIVDLKNL